jgi:hypothetical protein
MKAYKYLIYLTMAKWWIYFYPSPDLHFLELFKHFFEFVSFSFW